MSRTMESSYRADRDKTVAMMRARMDTLRSELRSLGATAAHEDRRVGGIRYQIREYGVEVQKKFSIAAAALVFVLIGVPLALRFPRGEIGMVIGVSPLIFSIYHVSLDAGEKLANRGYVPPVLAM